MVAIGLGLYSLWRLTTAVLPGDNDLETWGHRSGHLASGIVYGFLAFTALRGALAGGSSSSASGRGGNRVAEYTREVAEMTGGRLLVGIAGIGAVVLGGCSSCAVSRRSSSSASISATPRRPSARPVRSPSNAGGCVAM